jgi:non-ribosomal peptide synthetase component F
LKTSLIDTQVDTAKFDVAVFLKEEAQEIVGHVNYRTDLFHADSIARLIRHFDVLLQSIVTAPNVPIAQLEMFAEEEKQQELSLKENRQKNRHNKLKDTRRRLISVNPES